MNYKDLPAEISNLVDNIIVLDKVLKLLGSRQQEDVLISLQGERLYVSTRAMEDFLKKEIESFRASLKVLESHHDTLTKVAAGLFK